MNSINQNINNKYDLPFKNIGFKANAPAISIPNIQTQMQTRETELPDMYYMPEHYQKPKSFKEGVKKWDMLGLVYQWLEHPFLMLGTCLGISVGIDAFERSCNKEYDKSVIGKAAHFGDKIEKSKFIQSDNSQKAIKGIGNGWGKFKNFALKNSVIYSMFKTPSQPEMAMPRDEIKGINFRVVTKFKELVRALDIMPSEAEGAEKIMEKVANTRHLTLKSLAVDNEETEYLKKIYKVDKLSKINEQECVNRLNLRRIGKTESEIASIIKKENASELVKQEMFKKLTEGFTKEDLELVMKDEYGVHLDKVIKMSKNIEGLKVNNFPLMGIIKTPGARQPLANVLSGRGIYNMGYSLKEGAETNTGKFMSKFVQMLHRGFTFGGTKFGVMLFVAPLLVETMINTKKADKKEKVGTAVEGVVNTVSWVFTFPLILKAMHAYGGIQYAGMGKEKYEKYRDLVNSFNKKAIEGKFKDKKEYNEAKKALKKELKKLRHVEKQSFFTKMLRGASHLTKADLLSIESYRGSNKAMNFVRQLPDKIINKFGFSAARFMVFMMVGMSLADKLIKKCTAAIFGKAYDQYKEEEIQDAKEQQEEFTMNDLRARMIEAQKNKLNPQPEAIAPASTTEMPKISNPAQRMLNEIEHNEKENDAILKDGNQDSKKGVEKISPIQNEKIAQNEIEPKKQGAAGSVKPENEKRDNYTYIPSPVNVLNQVNPQEQINKYIPAQTGIQLNKAFDNSGIDAALRRAERAEKRAISTLAGNFGSAN